MKRKGKGYRYLGKKVKDVKKKGLDALSEYKGILKSIKKDYKAERISEKTARGRLLLLYRLSFKKNNSKIKDVPAEKLRKLRKEIKEAMKSL